MFSGMYIINSVDNKSSVPGAYSQHTRNDKASYIT